MLTEMAKYRDLLTMITWREIRLKYKQSVMGFLWAILMPMLITLAGVAVRLAYAKASNTPVQLAQVATVAVKALPWAFFIAALRFSTVSLTANSNLVTKIYFPREIFPVSAILSQLFDFAIAVVCVVGVLFVAQVGISIHLLWVPLLILLLVLFVTGLGLFLSAANLFFRDVKYLVEVFATFGIFVTPVFYEASMLGEWKWAVLLNPVAVILEALNDCVVLNQAPEGVWLTYCAAVSLALFGGASIAFKRLEPKFAECI